MLPGKTDGYLLRYRTWRTAVEDYDRGGVSGIANAPKRDNCRISPGDILNTKIPDDCDVLVVAGPTKAYLTEELNIIPELS